jgi:chemotaxis-related protein WspB
MLYLLFQLGQDRYALAANHVVEVLPLVAVKTLPGALRGVAGLMDYRGDAVPVIDLSALALGVPAVQRTSTRLFMVRYPLPGGGERLLGLTAERGTETMKCAPEDFRPTGAEGVGVRYLGPVVRDARGLIQRVELAALLTDELCNALFPETAGIAR